jgi:hypothetical protein
MRPRHSHDAHAGRRSFGALLLAAGLSATTAGASGVLLVSNGSLGDGALQQAITLPLGGTTPPVSVMAADRYLYDDAEPFIVTLAGGEACPSVFTAAVDVAALSGSGCPYRVYDPSVERFVSYAALADRHGLPADGNCSAALTVRGAFVLLDDIAASGCPALPRPRFSATRPDPSADRDNDGVPDRFDAFPDDPGESADNDGDGIGDNGDPDDDNDGLPDAIEQANALNQYDAGDAVLDADDDGLDNLDEFHRGTDIRRADSDGDGVSDGTEVGSGRNPRVNEPAVLVPAIEVMLR